MYIELLNKTDYSSVRAVEHVLDNLCEETKSELVQIYGKDYRGKAFEAIRNSDIYAIKLKSNDEPVGLYGLIEQTDKSAGIFLLTTSNLHKANLITFLKKTKKQIREWAGSYKLIMDYCSKRNRTIQKWLFLLGFKPSEYEDENFQIWYLGDIKLY